VSRDNLLRRLLSHFIVPEDQDIYYLHRRQLSKTGESQVCELRVLRLDQTLCWVRLETAAVIEESGEVVGYRTVMSDITARAQAEAALRDLNATLERRVDERTAALAESEQQLRCLNVDLAQALRLKDEFLALVTHELRTPLSTILFVIDSLLEGVYGPPTEQQRQAVLRAQQSGQQLLTLISDIIDLTHIAAGHGILDLQSINVASLCAMAMLLIKPAAEAKGIQVQQMIAPGITQLCADERRITQILVHLLNNALKFTPAGGLIGLDVAIDASRDHILLSVWDTGIGITPADQHRAFEPFIQLDGRLSREYDGAGLGLTLVQRLTELHGGSVDLVSAPNQGSRFTVSLPWSG
jgi:signal transduction histidine kinase